MNEMKKTMDERAEEYWKSLVRPLAAPQGLTETAYVVGALDQDAVNRKEIAKIQIALAEITEIRNTLWKNKKALEKRMKELENLLIKLEVQVHEYKDRERIFSGVEFSANPSEIQLVNRLKEKREK